MRATSRRNGKLRQDVSVREHSLVADEASLPNEWAVIARGDGLVMAMAHTQRPMAGVQFHPESILTPHGPKLLRNVLRWMKDA